MSAFAKKVIDALILGLSVVCGPVAVLLSIILIGLGDFIIALSNFVGLVSGYVLPEAHFQLVESAQIPLARINTFIPLAENWAMMLAYLSLAASYTSFRFLKSLIPGMSN